MPPEDRLDSWKEIAAYLHRDVTTVQRWEKREGMPVHRHLHARIGSVYASRAELDAWARGRNLRPAENGTTAPAPENGHAVESPDSSPQPAPAQAGRPRWRLILPLAALTAVLAGATVWLQRTEYFWRSPIAGARFQILTDFAGVEQAAAVSRDGQFVAFLSDRDGPMNVWVTQVGSGVFHNLTRGSGKELANPELRSLGFSPDGASVTYWDRKQAASNGSGIGIWAAPTLGGQPRPYLEGVAEFDWSQDGSRLVYHTPGTGDPMFVSDGSRRPQDRPIFTAPAGIHCHFPLWSPDGKFVYFVRGSFPGQLDIFRIRPAGGIPERITSQNRRVSHPVLLDRRTLLYLASDADGSGPWLYSMDVERRIPHRLTSGLDRYTSLAATADGRRLVVTRATPQKTLWRLHTDDAPGATSGATSPTRIPLTTGSGFSPRLGPDYVLYASAAATSQSLWKLANGTPSELWNGLEAQLLSSPAISPDGRAIAFAVRQRGQTLLYVMQADGANARILADTLDLRGAPAWTPDGQSITCAVEERGVPHLYRVPVDGRKATRFMQDYSLDPAWSPDGGFAVYSGPDIGTVFSLKAVTSGATPHPLPTLNLTRGSRHLSFLAGGRKLAFLRGEMHHKNLWLVDLESGDQRPLTNLAGDFDARDFDISPDGRDIVLERQEERSDVVLVDLSRP